MELSLLLVICYSRSGRADSAIVVEASDDESKDSIVVEDIPQHGYPIPHYSLATLLLLFTNDEASIFIRYLSCHIIQSLRLYRVFLNYYLQL